MLVQEVVCDVYEESRERLYDYENAVRKWGLLGRPVGMGACPGPFL